MLTLALWCTGILLEWMILVRLFKNRSLRKYPFFCIYIVSVLLGDIWLFFVYRSYGLGSPVYQYAYWAKEFICVIAGYCLVVEILEKALASYEGPRTFARNAALWIFALVVGFTTFQWRFGQHSSALRTSVEVERNLRSAEIALLAGILLIVFYYAIPIGRNLKGIALGYGLYVAIDVIDQAVMSHAGSRFQAIFSSIRSYSYFVSLLIWVVALWSYYPNPVPRRPSDSGPSYDVLAMKTRKALESMRGNLGKAARP